MMDKNLEPELINKKGLTDWANEPKISDLMSDYNLASGARDTQVSKIDDWVAQLNVEGIYKPKQKQGRSSVQPQLIRKQAEWRYTSLSEPFLNDENIFNVEPRTWMDREAAKQNSQVLNYQFNVQLNKVNLIDKVVRTAVNEGTAILRVEWDMEESKVTDNVPQFNYAEADEQAALLIQQAMQMQGVNPLAFKTFPKALQQSILASEENGRPILATVSSYVEKEVTKVVRNQPNVTICDYHNITPDPTCEGDFDKANFLVYSFETSRSELEKMEIYKNLDKIPEDASDSDGNHVNLNDSSFKFSDKTRKKIIAYEYWGFWDIDNSGVTTPIVATWVGEVMIRMEINPFPDRKIPFVFIPYLPVKGSLYGEPDAALLSDNQKLIGALVRGQVDSMARSANAQIGIRKDALDTLNLRKFKQGEDYFFNPTVDPRMAVIEHSYPELPASTFNLLQMFNLESEAMTGVKTFSQGMSGDSLGSTAAGVQGVIGASGKRELGILRRLAHGLQEVATKILAMNSEWLEDEEIIRITDEEFVKINRDNLLGSFDIKLSISNAETDAIKAQELSFMLQTMGGSLPFDMTKLILSRIADLRGMPDLSRSINNYQPEPDPMQQIEMQKAQLEMQKLQAEIQKLQSETQMMTPAKVQSELAKARKAETEANLNDLDFVEQETGVKQERELELMNAQAESNAKRDLMNNVFNTVQKSKEEKKPDGK